MQQNTTKSTYQSFRYILGAVLTYSIGSFYFGYTLSYFNSIEFIKIYQIFNITMPVQKAQGFFSGCISFGALFGAIFSSHIIKKYSRKQSFIVVDILAIISYLLIILPSSITLFFGRFLQGFCVGFFSSLVPLMIKQFSPIQLSGSFGAIMVPAIGCGFFSTYLLAYVLNCYLPVSSYWYVVFAFPITIIILQLVLILKIYNNQTPKYLISQGKYQQARNLISKIYKLQHVERIFNQKMIDFQKSAKQIIPQNQQIQLDMNDSYKQKQNVFDNNQNNMKQAGQIVQINEKQKYPTDIKTAQIFAFLLQMFHQLSGISIVTIYSAHLAKQALPNLQAQIPLIINGQKIFAGLCGTLLLNRYGRRYLMLRGLIVILFSLICLFIGFSLNLPDSQILQIFIIIFLITFVSAFVSTQGPITWLYIPQIIQPPLIPYTTMTNWIVACIVITTFPMLRNHIQQLFLFCGFATIINFIICYHIMIQTKDKKQIQVRKQFVQKQKKLLRIWKLIKNYLNIGNQQD